MSAEWSPQVEISMLVRRPPDDVWEAFVDPERIRRFWLASSSGRLESGATVHWRFKPAGAETDVEVLQARRGELLDLRWDGGQPVTLTFAPHRLGTLVGVRVTDFAGDQPAADACEASSGFTLVLSSLKLSLEHGIHGVLLYDRFPDVPYADAGPG